MTLEQVLQHFASCYSGTTTCMEDGCSCSARHMPVVMFAVTGNYEKVWPTAVLGYGVCSEHKRELRLADVDTGTAGGIISKVSELLQQSKQGSIDLERTNVEWIDLPLRN